MKALVVSQRAWSARGTKQGPVQVYGFCLLNFPTKDWPVIIQGLGSADQKPDWYVWCNTKVPDHIAFLWRWSQGCTRDFGWDTETGGGEPTTNYIFSEEASMCQSWKSVFQWKLKTNWGKWPKTFRNLFPDVWSENLSDNIKNTKIFTKFRKQCMSSTWRTVVSAQFESILPAISFELCGVLIVQGLALRRQKTFPGFVWIMRGFE